MQYPLKGEKSRHVAITDGVPCLLWDIDPWLTPVSLLIPQMWCKCMNYMNILSNIKEVMHFSENQNLIPMTPDWPSTPKKIEGLKLMHMYELHKYTMKNRRVNAFSVKIKIWTLYDPKWPQVDIWPHNIGRWSQADEHVWVLWSCYVTWTSCNIFSENELLTPSVTPNYPRLTFDPMKLEEGLKLINMYKSYGHAM